MKNLKFNKTQLILSVIALFFICVVVSIISFRSKWGAWPEVIDVFLGISLYAPFAIPKAFGDTLRITNPYSVDSVVPMMFLYWPVVIGLLWYMVRSRLVSVFVIIAIISLTAAFNWQIVATGMTGI